MLVKRYLKANVKELLTTVWNIDIANREDCSTEFCIVSAHRYLEYIKAKIPDL